MNVRVRTMNFDAIAAARPVNKQAALAHTNRGEHFDVPIPPGLAHFKTPPPPLMRWAPTRAGYVDLTGRKIGRLTVVRFHGITQAKRYTWLVRCACGDYELRRGESLVKSTDDDNCCYVCKHTKRLQAEAAAPSTPQARQASAGRLDALAEGIAAGILGSYVQRPKPSRRVRL